MAQDSHTRSHMASRAVRSRTKKGKQELEAFVYGEVTRRIIGPISVQATTRNNRPTTTCAMANSSYSAIAQEPVTTFSANGSSRHFRASVTGRGGYALRAPQTVSRTSVLLNVAQFSSQRRSRGQNLTRSSERRCARFHRDTAREFRHVSG